MSQSNKEKINVKLKEKGFEIVGEYVNGSTTTTFKHHCGHIWEDTYLKVRNRKFCPNCTKRNPINIKNELSKLKKSHPNENFKIYSLDSKGYIDIEHLGCGLREKVLYDSFCARKNPCFCLSDRHMDTKKMNKLLQERYGDEYQFLEEYKNSKTRIKYIHRDCGYVGLIRPYDLFSGSRRCYNCYGPKIKTHKEFMEKLNLLWPNKYKVLGEYQKSKDKVRVRHECGYEWDALPQYLYKTGSCPKCGLEEQVEKRTLSSQEIQNKIIKNIGEGYTVVGEYQNCDSPLEIQHECGFKWAPTLNNLLKSKGCPVCKNTLSNPEFFIYNLLKNNEINFQYQYRIPECKNIRSLPFDFAIWINGKLYLIEYQGRQHFQPIDFFGGEKRFEELQKNDNIKKQYCIENKIPLIYFNYNQQKDEIESILLQFIKEALL